MFSYLIKTVPSLLKLQKIPNSFHTLQTHWALLIEHISIVHPQLPRRNLLAIAKVALLKTALLHVHLTCGSYMSSEDGKDLQQMLLSSMMLALVIFTSRKVNITLLTQGLPCAVNSSPHILANDTISRSGNVLSFGK